MSVSTRTVYKGGIVRLENKGIEISCMCECDRCKQRYEYSKYRELRNVSHRNRATIVVWDKGKYNQAMEFAKNWTCKDGSVELKTEYIYQYD